MPEVCEVAENIYLIDVDATFIPKLTSAYFINEETKVLIEAGSPAATGTLLSGIRHIGINPEDISYIIVTHIHIDHAGGAGVLIKEMPQAKVLVHPRGKRHLVDPTKLVNSTREVQGEATLKRYGSVVPVNLESVQAAEDNQVIPIGPDQNLKIIYTPGHAHHHLSIYEEKNKGLFTGEVAGIYSPELEIILPNTPPPNFDLQLNLESLEKVTNLSPNILYFSHFGTTRKAVASLETARNKLKMWADIICQAVEACPDEAIERLYNFVLGETEPIREKSPALYESIVPIMLMSVKGYVEYFNNRRNKAPNP